MPSTALKRSDTSTWYAPRSASTSINPGAQSRVGRKEKRSTFVGIHRFLDSATGLAIRISPQPSSVRLRWRVGPGQGRRSRGCPHPHGSGRRYRPATTQGWLARYRAAAHPSARSKSNARPADPRTRPPPRTAPSGPPRCRAIGRCPAPIAARRSASPITSDWRHAPLARGTPNVRGLCRHQPIGGTVGLGVPYQSGARGAATRTHLAPRRTVERRPGSGVGPCRQAMVA